MILAEFRNHTMQMGYYRFPGQHETVVRCFSTDPKNSLASEEITSLCLFAPAESQVDVHARAHRWNTYTRDAEGKLVADERGIWLERVFPIHQDALNFVHGQCDRLGLVHTGEWVRNHA